MRLRASRTTTVKHLPELCNTSQFTAYHNVISLISGQTATPASPAAPPFYGTSAASHSWNIKTSRAAKGKGEEAEQWQEQHHMAVMRLLRNAGSVDVSTPPELSFKRADYSKCLTTYFDTFSTSVVLQFLCGAFSGPKHALKTQETLHNRQSWHDRLYTF